MSTLTKDKLSLTLPRELIDRVREKAVEEHRSVSGQIAYFLSLAVAQSDTYDDNTCGKADGE